MDETGREPTKICENLSGSMQEGQGVTKNAKKKLEMQIKIKRTTPKKHKNKNNDFTGISLYIKIPDQPQRGWHVN